MKKFVTLILCSIAVLQSYGQTAESFLKLGQNRAIKGDYTGAIADYDKAIELNPKYAEVYFNRGIAKFILKEKDGACLDWSKAGALGDANAYDLIKKYCN